MKSILVIYPEVDLTKIALYKGGTLTFLKSIRHKPEDLQGFSDINDQLEYRTGLIMNELKANEIDLENITVVMARGGLIRPVPSGIYQVNERMKEDLRLGVMGRHATNLGGLIADKLCASIPSAKAYLADPVVVDELDPLARVSGHPLIERKSIFHALNHKNISYEYAKSINKRYEDLNLVVAYIGSGGVSVGAHKFGKVVDVNQAFDGDGPFSVTRAGSLPVGQLTDLCYSGKYTHDEMRRMLTEQGGLVAYLGTNSLTEILSRVEAGDENAKFIIQAMAYQIAKEIGSMATVLICEVDAILIMGAILNNKFFTDELSRRIHRIASVSIYPVVNDMDSLAINGNKIISGEAEVLLYE